MKNPIKGGTPAIENSVEVKIKLIAGHDFKEESMNKDKLFEYPKVWRVQIIKIEEIL